MKRFILMAIAAIFLLSCNKEAGNPFDSPKGTIQSSPDANDFSIHEIRYYDSLGILHNQILASFQKVSGPNNRQTPENFRQFVSEYMKDKEHHAINSATDLPSQKVLEIIKHYLRNDFGTIKNPAVETCLKSIFDEVKATKSFDTVQYKEGMFMLENKIREDKKLRPLDKDMLLATTAIARHSGCYWLDFYANQTEKIQTGRIKIFDKLVKAVGVTLADATAIAYEYFSNRPVDGWVEDAAWFSEIGYWSIDHLQNGDTYKWIFSTPFYSNDLRIN